MYDIAQDLLDSFRATPAILHGLLLGAAVEQAVQDGRRGPK